jgi:hypothetical protein
MTTERKYSVLNVTYRPDITKQETVLLAVFLVEEPLGQAVQSKRLENWESVLAADPNAEIDLIAGILDEIESELRQDRSFLERAAEWSTSIEVCRSQVSSAKTPAELIEALFRSYSA